MPLLRRCLLALLLLVAAPAWAGGDTNWFYRGTDIQPDPAWTFGTLPNGLRYAVRRNAEPDDQVSIRLRIDAGSLHEADAERGWAHFVEHMAFRGTENFRDGEARETWQRLGASFGSDTNASTEPTQTVYKLDLPRADPAGLGTSLKLLADMADKALFDPKLVEAERGVVLSEYDRRTELAARLGDTMRSLFFRGLTFANRDTIGTEETLRGATAEGLKAFYERWYRPERATLVMVGDADPAAMEALIAAHFSGWQGSGPAPAEPGYGRIAQVAERTDTLAYPGAPHFATVSWIRPYQAVPHTRARETADLARALARRILNRRLEAKARGESAYLNAQVASERSTNIADYTQLSVMAKDGRWREALNEAWAIVADAVAAPPSETEIARELDNLRSAGQAAVDGDATLRSQQRAQRLITALDGNSVISSAEGTLALFEALAPKMTPDAVGTAVRDLFSGTGPRMVLLSPQPVDGVAEALAAAEQAAPAVRQAERAVTIDDLPKLGAPGREVSRERIEDLGVDVVTFDNGTTLLFRKTDFEKGKVGVQLRFGEGLSGLPADEKSLAWLAPLVTSSGIGDLDLDAMERLMTGRRMSLAFGAAEDAFELGGSTNAEQLGDQLRLLAAKLAHPRWDPALFVRYTASALENYELSYASAAARAGREFPGFSRRGDPRWAPFERDEIANLTAADVERFFAPILAEGPIEAIVVGDVELDAVIAAMRGTVGALPKRPETAAAPASRAVQPPLPGAPVRFTHQGDADQAYAVIGWSTLGGIDRIAEQRALGLAANMAQVRLFERLRDVEGATYSPRAASSTSESFPDFGIFYAAAELRPDRTDLFFRLAREIVADLAARPAEADEYSRALTPVLTGIERRLRTNGYWLSAMEGWSRRPELIAQTRTYLSDYRDMTAQDVQAAVAAHVADAPDWSLLVLPGAREGAAAGPGER